MDQTVNAVLNLDKGAKVGQVSHTSMHPSAYLVTFVQRLPRILLHLLHTKANAACLRVDIQHFDFNRVSGVYDLAGMLDALGPAHFGNVNQAFHARFKFYKSAIVRYACDPTIQSGANGKPFLNTGPWIGEQLLVTK